MKHRVECLILLKQLILEGEIRDAKMRSFSSDFQTLVKHSFILYFLHELLMSLKSSFLLQSTNKTYRVNP